MFLRMRTEKSIPDCSAQINKLKAAVDESDCIIVGAGAGLSASAGFEYGGERFKKYFSDFEAKYGVHDMYSGGFCDFESENEFWAYWSRYIYLNRYCGAPKNTYEKLLKILNGRDYFVITTNVDHCFQKAGFDKKRLFYTQGDYGLFQCSVPCGAETFDNEEIILKMRAAEKDMKIPDSLLPRCPHCGAPLIMNLRSDDDFVEDSGWHAAAERYMNFMQTRKNQKILFLELGVGANTPGIIKYPFWRAVYNNKNAVYACLNFGEAYCPREIENRSICIDKDIDFVLGRLIETP